ncbi:TIE1 [Branchiostoma lanceolatum]|uniref:TIE1 protein n=1 Tax=Branchiostoma lanceolatum TaxID=7740 RepID=A0A8J9ZDC7_BRALA|nr:TIE1 [Branchiostoma lanceolatum]
MSCCTGYNGRVVSRIGAALAVLGFLSLRLGIFGLSAGFSPIGTPIWSGVMVFITGCLGLKSGKQPTNKCARTGFLTLSIISVMTSLTQWVTSAWAIGDLVDICNSTTSRYWCGINALQVVHLLLGLAECALCLTSSIQCCVGISTVPEKRAGLQLDGAHRGGEITAADSNRGETEAMAVGTCLDATEINVTTLADVEENRPGLQLDDAHRGRERTAAASIMQLAWKDIFLSSKLLGAGHFGEVRKGTVKIDGDRIQSAIKVLKRGADEESKEEFRQEVDIMRHAGVHPNIINLLGVCNHDGQQYMALELAAKGDLLKYLRKSRVHMTSRPYANMRPEVRTASNLSPVMLLRIACDVASGMEHLAAKDVIHRDLAARNVLLSDSLIAKVADFGLSRGEGIYVQKSGKAVPFRSTAIEALNTRTYTTESDVWSFGILLWEIVTLGGTPYSGMKSRLLLRRLHDGYRLPKPRNCEDALYHMMKSCWELLPTDRPTFSDLVRELTGMVADMTTYINIDDDYEYEVVVSGDEDDDDFAM